ncbi:DUF4157 domain-containing protein [Actinoplanes sp. LDG1-06]|uniref:DUF4157 domain-containing protein n=1 Tax=Paractinoplanes ovalisporus TaxID=2810368 RepID=A0ABS2A2C4_9ACTN|nr:DUF4157 domain-containing protein [Actinoplanes ovalisporus]MBM2613990.1 DUF4157 domain-containing protein [Actinoplanes ovalisporus]
MERVAVHLDDPTVAPLHAFTRGTDVHVAPGKLTSPLLAHELAHVAQQRSETGPVLPPGRLEALANVSALTGAPALGRAAPESVLCSPSAPRKILTIAEFIVFVEEVERAHPHATPAEVASEVRQLWYHDANWQLLAAGQGMRAGGAQVDIRDAGTLAQTYDMNQVAPRPAGSLSVMTPGGPVDVGHVMAGIDTAISGSPAAYPEKFLEETGSDTFKNEAKYDALQKATGGDSRDFATWAGDLGQAYADFLIDRYVKKGTATLADLVAAKAPPDELLGDVQGYIAVPASPGPAGSVPVSRILRGLYGGAVPSTAVGAMFDRATGRPAATRKAFVKERVLAFARMWFAKDAYARKGLFGSKGTTPSEMLENHAAEFDRLHAAHDTATLGPDKLDKLLDDFLTSLEPPPLYGPPAPPPIYGPPAPPATLPVPKPSAPPPKKAPAPAPKRSTPAPPPKSPAAAPAVEPASKSPAAPASNVPAAAPSSKTSAAAPTGWRIEIPDPEGRPQHVGALLTTQEAAYANVDARGKPIPVFKPALWRDAAGQFFYHRDGAKVTLPDLLTRYPKAAGDP